MYATKLKTDYVVDSTCTKYMQQYIHTILGDKQCLYPPFTNYVNFLQHN